MIFAQHDSLGMKAVRLRNDPDRIINSKKKLENYSLNKKSNF